MEFLVVEMGATLAAVVSYLAIVVWHDITRDS
jgi:hypothetical protein